MKKKIIFLLGLLVGTGLYSMDRPPFKIIGPEVDRITDLLQGMHTRLVEQPGLLPPDHFLHTLGTKHNPEDIAKELIRVVREQLQDKLIASGEIVEGGTHYIYVQTIHFYGEDDSNIESIALKAPIFLSEHCPLCTTRYTDFDFLSFLPCGHTACEKCTLEYLCRFDSPREFLSSMPPRDKCPQCQQALRGKFQCYYYWLLKRLKAALERAESDTE